MPETISTLEQRREAERQKYLKLQPSGYGGTNHGKRAMATVLSWQPRFVVDFGCGRNTVTEELLDLMGLTPFADATASSLPYGRQKMLGIAIGLAAKPRLLLLDEPVAGLSAGETDSVQPGRDRSLPGARPCRCLR